MGSRMRKNSRNTEKQNKSVAPENKSSRKFFSGSFVRFSSFALLLLTALCVGVGFSSWNFTKPQGPTSISFSSVTASETEEYSFSVSSSMIDANTCFDAPAGDDIDETKLNGIISPVDGAEDLTFGIRLTFSPKSGDLTTDIISYIKGVNVAFGCSDATITDTTTQTSIRSWIENGYISLPGSASLLSSSYKFTPSIVSSNSVSVFSSTSVYDSTTTDIVTSHQWTKNNATSSTGIVYYLDLYFSFSWGSYFSGVNPVYTSDKTRDELAAGVTELSKTPVDSFITYFWVEV